MEGIEHVINVYQNINSEGSGIFVSYIILVESGKTVGTGEVHLPHLVLTRCRRTAD